MISVINGNVIMVYSEMVCLVYCRSEMTEKKSGDVWQWVLKLKKDKNQIKAKGQACNPVFKVVST